ncbi:hypothetical protein LZ30DRAFT_796193 [Colletotrichum cereale]|nr:hypothetical protein LZ30DRAFT_796193 [Colletotrichum cereale]
MHPGNPRHSTRVKGSASSAARGGTGQSHLLPIPAGGNDASSDKLSPEWLGTLEEDAVDVLQEWSWQDFTDDFLEQTLYSPQTTITSLSAQEGINTTTTSEQQDLFEHLSSITKTLEDYVQFLASQWDRKEIQNYPTGEVFGTFQAILTTLQIHRPVEKPGVLEDCQHTRTVRLTSHCYAVCVKTMEALAETLCQDMSAQASQKALRQPPGDVISANGSEVDFLVRESFSHLHPLASSLVPACTTLHTGVGILCKVEVELGVP